MTVDVKIYDNTIPEDFRKEVWEYINTQVWTATWKPNQPVVSQYVPNNEMFMQKSHKLLSARSPHMFMHRVGFARDEQELADNHPIITKLWNLINQELDNKYDIAGNPEGIFGLEHPSTPFEADDRGWRVYANGQLDETIKRSHSVHRDTKDVNDTSTRSILYVANLKWYPTWFAECVYYPEDPEELTGDHQQFHKGWGGQTRDFKVGWAEKIVSPVPGRIISYEGRTLHTTRPAAIWAPDIRKVVVFRARLKPEFQN